MSDARETKTPELVPGVDVRDLPLSALDGFVLSRIDGHTTAKEVALLTGLTGDNVAGILEKLIALGAVRWQGEPAPAPPAASSPPPERSARKPTGKHGRVRNTSWPSRVASHKPRRMMAEAPISGPPPSDTRPPRRDSSRGHPPVPGGSESGRSRRDSSRGHSPAPGGPTSARPAPSPSSAGAGPSPPPDERTTATSGAPPVGPAPPSQSPSGASGATSGRPPRAPEPTGAAKGTRPSSVPAAVNELREQAPSTAELVPPYDPAELDEDCDLPRERRKQVLDLYYLLEDLTYYDALGVPQDADRKEVRTAYFKLSRVFHPDTMFRKDLGSFKMKMEAVFKFLTEAYETLGKKKKRREYDAYLQATQKTVRMQRELEAPASDSGAAPAASGPPATSAPASPSPSRPVTEAGRKLAQQVVARRLRAASGPRPSQPPGRATPAGPPSPPPDSPASGTTESPSDPRQTARALAQRLRETSQITGSDRVAFHVRRARTAEAHQDWAEATREMRRAVSHAPERADLHVEHERLSQILAKELAADYEAQARYEQKQGKWASAALSWAKVSEGRPDDPVSARSAAQALLKAGGDLHRARAFAQKAVQLAPDQVEAHLVLAQVFLTADLKLNARRELERAAKLDPGNEMVKNLLADMKA